MKTTDIIQKLSPTKRLLNKYQINNYTINKDGSVDVDDNVDLDNLALKRIPIKFRYVSGDYFCHSNELTTLRNAPIEVGGEFYCSRNNLRDLQGAPREVGGSFWCNQNKLTSLRGAPMVVDGFYCSDNNLTSLQGAPRKVNSHFYCDYNKLTTLRGAPRYVGGTFVCYENNFTEEPDHSFIQIGDDFFWRD